MAGGSFEFGASGYLQGKIDWTSTSNGSSANTSTVTAILYARRTNSYTTYGVSWSGYVKIGSAQTNISFSSTVYVSSSWIEMARITTTVNHNTDGTGSVNISGSVTGPSGTALAGNTSSGNQTVGLDTIPRYANITSFSVSKRNENSVLVSFTADATLDYAWFSKDNGYSWAYLEPSHIIDGLNPSTGYNFKIRVKRQDSQLVSESWTVYQATYGVPVHRLNSRGLNTIKVNWACDSTVDGVWYSLDGGANWTSVGNPQSTSGTYTITGLYPYTTYNILTKIRRSISNTDYVTNSLIATTLDIGRITSAPNINFGDTARITKTNPSGVQNRLRIETLNPTTTIALRDYVGDDYTITFTDEEWDNLYKKLGDSNSMTIRYVIDTMSDTPYFNWEDRTLTLRGNQKTTHVGSGNKRAKVFVGLSGTVKRAVVWIGNNGRKRCI